MKKKVELKATDLRKGNLVGFGEEICRVSEINEDGSFRVINNKGESFKNTWAELTPIFISRALLSNCPQVKSIPHFTVGGNLLIDIGRSRHMSIACVGTPNEVIFLSCCNIDDDRKIEDAVCVHNFDYDGYMPIHRLQNLFSDLTQKELIIDL